MTITCICGAEFALPGHLTNHQRCCLGPSPTLEDLYRIGRVVITDAGCHEWARRGEGGYGDMPRVAARQLGERRAHRAAYVLAHGPIPPGLGVLHSCDNPPCIRPEHIRAGTRAENSADMVARGRHRNGRGRHRNGRTAVSTS